MKKELVVSLIIVVVIVISDIFLQKYTNKAMDSLNYHLAELKQAIKDDENFDMHQVEKIKNELDKNFKFFSCYLEHDELEKIKTQIVIISSGVENEDKVFVCEEIDRAIYIIDHIESKQMLKLDNIF